MTQHAEFIVAAVTDFGGYVNPIKIGIVVVLLGGWAAAAQWVDRDTEVVKTKREQWNLITLSGGLVGFAALFLGPWSGGLFLAGIVCWLAIVAGALIAYVLHRNARVVPAARILTVAHIKRVFSGDPAKKRIASAKAIKITLIGHDGKFVEPSTDPEESQAYGELQEWLYELLWRRATDVDLVPGKEQYRLVYKIDGVATEQPGGIPADVAERTIPFLKSIAGLNVEEIRRPQKGTIQAGLLNSDGDPGTTEVHTSGTTAGERLRLKIQAGPNILRIHELGIASARLESLKKGILAKSTGMLLVAAPKRNGLTTTEYAIVRSHDAYINNIHAIERRPLTDLDNITQQTYEGANTDVNYARMLQSILRREPDIIMVGECEDRETAQIAARAAADDRKIYMGIEANDCADALTKFLALAEDPKLVGKAIRGVMAQRLVRILCEQCREAFKPDAATLKKLNLPTEKIERFYRPPTEAKTDKRGKEVVCQSCQGTGYVGRIGIFELMIVDETVAALISAGAAMNKIKTQCRKNKMYYLQEEGLLKVIDGTTSMNEVLRCLRADGK